MAQFDVYRTANTYLLDCQSNFLSHLDTRIVVPLIDAGQVPQLARLNPVFVLSDKRLVMATQLVSSIRARELRENIGSLAEEHIAITNAFDMLLTGY